MKLRPGQIEVAVYRGGYLAVPAVPGAGKTTCLAYLAAELLEENPDHKILIVTVMNSAVSNFKHKIAGFLEERGITARGYEVKTLHSLAVQILRDAPEFVMVNDAFQIIDNNSQNRILKYYTERWLDANIERWKAFLKDDIAPSRLKKAYSYWRNRIVNMIFAVIKHIKLQGLTEQEIKEIRTKLESREQDSFLLWTLEVMQRYEERKRRDGAVDFDDMIALAYRLLLENEEIRERFQGRWTYIFEDEAQDSNPLQEKILRVLSEKNGNLVRVGDTNQGIMRFSGTDPELFRKFCQEEDVQKQPILVASRSTQQIMDFANSYVKWVRQGYPVGPCREALECQLIRGVDPSDPCPNPVLGEYGIKTYFCNGSLEDEALLVGGMAARFALAHPDKTISILMRQNKHLKLAAEVLRRGGVEFDYVGEDPDWSKEFRRVSDIVTIMRYLAEPYRKDLLQDLLTALIPQQLNLLEHFEPEELLYPAGGDINWTKVPADFPSSRLPELQSVLDDLRHWLELAHLRPDELVLQLAAELDLKGEQRDLANNMSAQLTMLIREHPEYDLSDIVREFATIDAHLKYMAGVLQNARGYSPRPGVVSLSTYHKAKGLEWDTVYAAGVAKDGFCELISDKSYDEFGYLPDDYKNPVALARVQLEYMLGEDRFRNKEHIIWCAKAMTISENLRLLYVAFTRARERLIIGTHQQNNWGGNLTPSLIFTRIKGYLEGERHE